MAIRISELNSLNADLSQADALPVVDLSAGETKQVSVANLINYGISGSPSSFIDLSKLNQGSATKLSFLSLANTGVASGTYGDASTVAQFVVNNQGLITTATGVPIVISAANVTGLAPVATSGTYASLSGLPTLGTLASQNANSIAVSGGTISGVTFISGNVTISGGTISGITDLAVEDGGTGASSAADARINLGLAIGSDVQAYSSVLSGVAIAYDSTDNIAYASASGVVATTPFTSFARSMASGATAGDVRSTLGLGSIATQDAGSIAISGGTVSGVSLNVANVTISGGTIVAITDLAVEDGGTGASTASGARANLGLVIGTDVQAYSSSLNQLSSAFDTSNVFVYSSASGVVATGAVGSVGRAVLSGDTASGIRNTIGLGSIATQEASSVGISGGTISGVTLGANNVTISGGTIIAITDLAVEDGGTGASTAAGARTNLGLAIGSDVQAYSSALATVVSAASGTDLFFYTTSSGQVGSSSFSNAARTVVAEATISGMRNALGLGSVALLDSLSIGTSDISLGAITEDAIADATITGAKIAQGTVTLANLADSSQSDILIGRATASGGQLEEIPCTAAARSILDDASIENIRETLGLGTLALQDGTFSGSSTGTNTGDQTIVLTGDVTGTGTGSFEATIADGAVDEAKIADSAVTTNKVASGSITSDRLADQSASIVIADSPSASGVFIGQQWFNTNNGYEYTWDGTQWIRQSALNEITVSGDTLYAFTTVYPDLFSAEIVPALNTQSANSVFVGPASGSDAVPTFRALQGEDLPAATASSKGAIIPGAGLSMNGNLLEHSNSVTSGVYYKVEVDAQGHISSGATVLEPADIPDLDASKITSGLFGSGVIADQAILATKLANYSTTKFGEAPPAADFIGQYFFNPLEKDLFLWDGNVWNPVGVSIGEIVFAGTYNASGNVVSSTTSEGSAVGLTIGQPLPAPSATFNSYYVVVESGGTGTSPAPEVVLAPPDIILCNGTAWVEIDVSSTYVSQTASQVSFTPAANLGSTNVQAALEEVSNECRNVNNVASGILDEAYGGTGFSSYTKGDILVASGTTSLFKLGVGSNGQVLTADSAESSGLKWATPTNGTVTSVNATAPISVASGSTTPHLSIANASTSAVGVVQLSDSTSTTSSTLAATPTAVKSAYDLANAALARTGGTITGAVTIGNTGSLFFEGSTNDGFETLLTVADPTADRTITLPNVTGTVITTGDSGTVTNAMLAGSITDTKLSTISTAGKVSNSATTATNANTANAIVSRDGSGNFSAGTISATIDEGTF